MVVDYRERKQVTKNRPKSKPMGMVFFGFAVATVGSFALGMMADRLLLKIRPPKALVASAPQTAPSQAPPPASAPLTANTKAAAAPSPPAEPSLTFYNTLPKGGKAILGSGINPRNEEARAASPAKHPQSAPPSSKEQAAPSPVSVKEERGTTPADGREKKASGTNEQPSGKAQSEPGKEAGAKKTGGNAKGKFAVQYASAKDRKEAEAIKGKLAEKGFAAYIVESSVAGKGTWYRVRVGKQMDQPAASEMATMIGKGAIVVPE
ncbi:SPOR domain-containing protein [Geobacter pickeringii]|uniref:SPOR domain-containing protein n=1 Tax=Geobacter pickeringii TaxID=345632 RepID=A0A0B5BEW8_9BACT|nr:SPOR domain-containing protein [Geobacter pickeringii]AJE03075.1 hypothetical protein GPICK_06575 [Geobacter pickeringii]